MFSILEVAGVLTAFIIIANVIAISFIRTKRRNERYVAEEKEEQLRKLRDRTNEADPDYQAAMLEIDEMLAKDRGVIYTEFRVDEIRENFYRPKHTMYPATFRLDEIPPEYELPDDPERTMRK